MNNYPALKELGCDAQCGIPFIRAEKWLSTLNLNITSSNLLRKLSCVPIYGLSSYASAISWIQHLTC